MFAPYSGTFIIPVFYRCINVHILLGNVDPPIWWVFIYLKGVDVMSMVLCGVVTGLKKGTPNEKGRTFNTLRVEVGDKSYYPMYEVGKLNPLKDQPITLVCDVKANKNFLNLFVSGHVADEMIVDPEQYADRGSSSFDQW